MRPRICAAIVGGAALLATLGMAAEPELAVPPADPAEITPEIRTAIDTGLRYLVRVQNRDGGWRARGAQGGYPTAMTALAGLALLASGTTPSEGPYAPQLSAGLSHILDTARRDGLIAAADEESHSMHGHGFAMLFLSQCLGMAEDARRDAQIREVLRRGVALTARSQSTAGGWLYTPDARSDEGSVTVTQVQALRACRNAGLAVPASVIDHAMAYLVQSQNDDGGVRYQASDLGPSRAPITAAAVVCWFNAGRYEEPRAAAALRFAEGHLPTDPGDAGGHHFYAHLYLAQAKYQRGGEEWRQYYRKISRYLLAQQRRDGAWMGDAIGPVYGTAVALIILQMPERHLPIMQR